MVRWQQVPNDDTLSFKQLFAKIREIHSDSALEHVYHLSAEETSVFKQFHDDIVVRRQQVPNDENRRGVLSKTKGQQARIALSLHCLEQVIEHSVTPEPDVEWSYSISEDTMHRTIFLLNHFIEQKFTLMPPEEKHPSSIDPDLADLSMFQRNFNYFCTLSIKIFLLRFLMGMHFMSISQICHLPNRIMPAWIALFIAWERILCLWLP